MENSTVEKIVDSELLDEVKIPDYENYILETSRVTKVTKGAKRFRFSAMVVVGNRNGTVGIGKGVGSDPKSSIEKAIRRAKDSMIKINITDNTITHEITQDFKASRIIFKPAVVGTGIIAGKNIKPILELAGVKDVLSKRVGSSNKKSNIYCCFLALKNLKPRK
jgi:small subunit ribosomal protein S5